MSKMNYPKPKYAYYGPAAKRKTFKKTPKDKVKATIRQLRFMRVFGIKYHGGITKMQAQVLISKHLINKRIAQKKITC